MMKSSGADVLKLAKVLLSSNIIVICSSIGIIDVVDIGGIRVVVHVFAMKSRLIIRRRAREKMKESSHHATQEGKRGAYAHCSFFHFHTPKHPPIKDISSTKSSNTVYGGYDIGI